MLIGISARIKGGKDTVSKMIQYYFVAKRNNNDLPFSFKEFENNDFNCYVNSLENNDWEIKKFAGKLKTIGSLLLGWPVEKFEDQDFKENFVVNMLTLEVYHKEDVGAYFDSSEKDLVVACIGKGVSEINITIRLFLQLLGTDIMRAWMPQVWVNSLFSDYRESSLLRVKDEDWVPDEPKLPNWLISDCRFPNEAEAIKRRGGINIRINRGEIVPHDPSLHPSETSLDTYEFDYVIDNNGTLEELYEKVTIMLNHFNLN